MTGNITRLPAEERISRSAPKRLMRPCDWGLIGAVSSLETQLGSIEAYNRLVEAAEALRAKVEAGNAVAQNPLFAADLGFARDPHR